MTRYYRRHLPHGAPFDSPLFVTWNLKDSLPAEALERIKRIREQFKNLKKQPDEAAKQIFRISEEFLDGAATGPLWLRETKMPMLL